MKTTDFGAPLPATGTHEASDPRAAAAPPPPNPTGN
jgi:hypothetical protein